MRVLLVLLSVNLFGTERHAVELANALAADHEVALLLRGTPADATRRPAYAALRAAVSPAVRVFLAGRGLPLFGLLRAMAAFRPDVVHAHNERSAAWASRIAFATPVIATNHCGYAAEYDRCDGLICLTEAQLPRIGPKFHGRVFRIGNWVLPRPRPGPRRVLALRAELGAGPGDYLIGSVGRLAPSKGHDRLVAAFLRADLPSARLAIVGEGSEAPHLRALAAAAGDRVVLTGFRSDARDLYAAFDLFVLNSVAEPFGLAILEALDAGVAVIASATEGAQAIAARSPITLVPIGDEAALAAALRRAVAERPVGRIDAAEPFRLSAALPRIVAAYGELVADRSRARTS